MHDHSRHAGELDTCSENASGFDITNRTVSGSGVCTSVRLTHVFIRRGILGRDPLRVLDAGLHLGRRERVAIAELKALAQLELQRVRVDDREALGEAADDLRAGRVLVEERVVEVVEEDVLRVDTDGLRRIEVVLEQEVDEVDSVTRNALRVDVWNSAAAPALAGLRSRNGPSQDEQSADDHAGRVTDREQSHAFPPG